MKAGTMSPETQDQETILLELKKSAVFLFRKKGKTTLTKEEIIYEPSLQLGWFNPPEGRTFLANLQAAGAITEKDGGNYILGFPGKRLQLPMDFRPKQELILATLEPGVSLDQEPEVEGAGEETPLEEPKADIPLLSRLLVELAEGSDLPEPGLRKEMERVREENPSLEPEVCTLVLARKRNLLKKEQTELVLDKLITDFTASHS